MLQFIYSGKVDRLKQNSRELLAAADIYQLSHLKSMCEDELAKELSVENAVEILLLADLHSSHQFKSKIIHFINSNSAAVSKTGDWTSMIKTRPGLIAEIYARCMHM